MFVLICISGCVIRCRLLWCRFESTVHWGSIASSSS